MCLMHKHMSLLLACIHIVRKMGELGLSYDKGYKLTLAKIYLPCIPCTSNFIGSGGECTAERHQPSSLGTVEVFMTEAVMKAAFFTLVTSLSSLTDSRSAKALPTSTVDMPDFSKAAVQRSVNFPSGLSCKHRDNSLCLRLAVTQL